MECARSLESQRPPADGEHKHHRAKHQCGKRYHRHIGDKEIGRKGMEVEEGQRCRRQLRNNADTQQTAYFFQDTEKRFGYQVLTIGDGH